MPWVKTYCRNCHKTFFRDPTQVYPPTRCPFCGSSPFPLDCPDYGCPLDIPDSTICAHCPKKPKPPPGHGGKRPGAGAPRGNLNRFKTGSRSRLLKLAIAKLAADKELRAFLFFIARAATEGVIPETTRKLLQEALETPQDKGRRLQRKARQRHG